MHLAWLYLRPEFMHLYPVNERSHHVMRWLANGVKGDYFA